jgi:hypothetical protein
MIEPHCLTIKPMLPGARFRPLSRAGENGFVGGKNGFVRTSRAGGAADENSGRAVNSCAAKVWETERILAPEAVDMLRTDVPIHRRGSLRPLPPTASTIRGIAGPSPAKGDNPAAIELEYCDAKRAISGRWSRRRRIRKAGWRGWSGPVDGGAGRHETISSG